MDNKFLYSLVFAVFSAAVIVTTGAAVWQEIPRGALQASLFSGAQENKEEFKLAQEELANLVKPAVVRVVRNIKGNAKIPVFDIDFEKKSVNFYFNYEPWVKEFEVPTTGSGFMVNPDGYILTNAHVVSEEMIRRYVIADVMSEVAMMQYTEMDQGQLANLVKDEKALAELGEKVYKEVSAKTTWNINNEIFVSDPTSNVENVEDLFENGFPASPIKVNENFIDDGRDVALIKINETELPSMKLSDAKDYNVGAKIFVFGFPSTASFNWKSFIEPTFTQGVINAVKDLEENSDFKIIQFDAKVSEGSSGSPMINENGEAIGIVTYQTTEELASDGDSFAFAIPIEVGKQFLDDASVENIAGNYNIHLQAGLELERNKRCRKAIEEFNLAKETNENFEMGDYVDSYIQKCNDMIAKGESVDDSWGEFKEWLRGIGSLGWTIIAIGTLVFIILIVFIVMLARKMKGKEKEINHLEDIMLEEAARETVQRDEVEKMMKTGGFGGGAAVANNIDKPVQGIAARAGATISQATANPVINPAGNSGSISGQTLADKQTAMPIQNAAIPANPELAGYIKQAREYGMDNNAIIEELRKTGWSDNDIQSALAVK